MKYFAATLLCTIIIIAVSCKKTVVIPNGIYSGTFQRLTDTGGQVSNVTMRFSFHNWAGQSDVQKYPALCNGTYKENSDSITFVNVCFWTADFDWSLILNGNYKINLTGSELELTRSYNGLYTDVYKLTRQ